MTPLTYRERKELWEWCRELIDREAIYRVDDGHPPIPSKALGGTYDWQFYLRRATFNPAFAHSLAILFWDRFSAVYSVDPFQICACDPSGVPIAMAIQTHFPMGVEPPNVFVARREPKGIGVDNWFDGRVIPETPVLMVDDIAASAPFLLNGATRVKAKLGLPLHHNYFVVVNKVGRGFGKAAQHTENYLDNELVALFTMNNFCRTAEDFIDRYGARPVWTGIVK